MKFNLTHRLHIGAKKVPSITNLAAIFFYVVYLLQNNFQPLISTFVNKLMINYHSLCYFCEIVGHFGFYSPKKHPMNIQSKQILCG